jgi:ATP-dependent DNA helicase RecQ
LAEVEQMLNYLQQVGILVYQKQKNMPQLTFLTARQDVNYLTINLLEVQRRKKKDLQKATAVMQFIGENRRCRQQLLQEYFNELTNIICGVCDNCLKQKKIEKSIPIDIYTKYRQKIIEIIPAPIIQIVDYQFFNNKSYVKEVIRKMIENEEIRMNELGVLEQIYSSRTQK